MNAMNANNPQPPPRLALNPLLLSEWLALAVPSTQSQTIANMDEAGDKTTYTDAANFVQIDVPPSTGH